MAASNLWACQLCTFENQTDSKCCEMCGNMKAGSSTDQQDSAPTSSNEWKCVLCTFVNSVSQQSCGICAAPSPIVNDLAGKRICEQCTSINVANATKCEVCKHVIQGRVIQFENNNNVYQPQPMNVDDDELAALRFIQDDFDDFDAQNNTQYANPFANAPPQHIPPPHIPMPMPMPVPPQQMYGPPQPQPLPQPQYQPPYQAPYQQPQYQQPHAYIAQNHAKKSSWFGQSVSSWFGGGQSPNNAGPPKKRRNSRHKHKHRHHNSNGMIANNNGDNDDKKIDFQDVTEIFKKDANDKDRIKKEAEEIKILSDLYAKAYLTKKKNYDLSVIKNVISKMIEFIPKSLFEEIEKNKKEIKEEKVDLTACSVCFCEYDDNEGQLIVMQEYCNHSMICKSCFVSHLSIKIKEDDITPWIPCPAPDCKAPVCPNLLVKHLKIEQLYKFAWEFIRKHLQRNPNWINCVTKNCKYGWVVTDKNSDEEHKLKCKSCKKTHKVSKNPIKSDKGFNELIKDGTLRLCPKCELPTMKDKGMCNVMHCGKCGIYWNWRTRETGTSSSQLKNRSRQNGTLWEPGELQYQMSLQQTNVKEFKLLLERNGIKYDPNYRRGQR